MKKRWIEIVLEINGDLPELFYEFLYENFCLGIKEDEKNRIKIYFNKESSNAKIIKNLKIFSNLIIQNINEIEETNWNENWKQYFKPIEITKRIIVSPPWEAELLDNDKIYIKINPEMAFGTGTHETTKLCIKALDEIIPQIQKPTLLDIGCGSGILSIVASKLGASFSLGIDIDPICIKNSFENANINNVSNIFFTTKDLAKIKDQVDIIIANLLLSELMLVKDQIFCHLKKDGYFITSGFYTDEIKDVLYLLGNSFIKINEMNLNNWGLLIFRLKG